MLFAEKKGGRGLYLCVDCQSLKANMVTDVWLLLHINDLLALLKGARVFNSLDLLDGYHLILIDPADRYKMAFACYYG